jgi:hydroxyacylglutathione hydrolase
MAASAAALFRSVRGFSAQPDHLQIWPGHGAGSACGKSLGSMPQTTLGYEKLFNWAFAEMSEREFVDRVLENQPVPPRYFAVMKRVNREAGTTKSRVAPNQLALAELDAALSRKARIIDTRAADRFAAGHVPGTLNIPLGKSFLNWVGALVPGDGDFYVIAEAESDDAVQAIAGDLAKIGLTSVAGFFRSSVVHEWETKHGTPEEVPQLTARQLHDMHAGKQVQIVDVRAPDEWARGHVPGAIHIPLAALPERLGELDRSLPIVLHCKGGGRSSIATSFLQTQGVGRVSNLAGGYDGWVAEGLEVER